MRRPALVFAVLFFFGVTTAQAAGVRNVDIPASAAGPAIRLLVRTHCAEGAKEQRSRSAASTSGVVTSQPVLWRSRDFALGPKRPTRHVPQVSALWGETGWTCSTLVLPGVTQLRHWPTNCLMLASLPNVIVSGRPASRQKGKIHEAAEIYCAPRQLDRVGALGARAAADIACDRVSRQRGRRCDRAFYVSLSGRA